MSPKNVKVPSSVPLNATHDNLPSEASIKNSSTETTFPLTWGTHRDDKGYISPQGYGGYPMTEHRYGSGIGTGIYDRSTQDIVYPGYSIHESDFERTSPDSGKGIHARQYHGTESDFIPVGTTSYIRDTSGTDTNIRPGIAEPDTNIRPGIVEPDTNIRPGIAEPDTNIRPGIAEPDTNIRPGIVEPDTNIRPRIVEPDANIRSRIVEPDTNIRPRIVEPEVDRDRSGRSSLRDDRLERDKEAGRAFEEKRRRELENERRRQSELNRKRHETLVAEQERIQRERIDTNIGSIHGLFGHGRHRDALLVGRDTDATDFGSKTGGKLDAGRDRRSSTGSWQDRMIGTIEGRERLAKEQDARIDSVLASQAATEDTTRRGGIAPGASNVGDEAQARERATTRRGGTIPGTSIAGDEAQARERATARRGGTAPGASIAGDEAQAREWATTRRGDTAPGTNIAGDEAQARERATTRRGGTAPGASVAGDEAQARGGATMMDKAIGGTKTTIGKGMSNPTMVAKGEERAAGLGKN